MYQLCLAPEPQKYFVMKTINTVTVKFKTAMLIPWPISLGFEKKCPYLVINHDQIWSVAETEFYYAE